METRALPGRGKLLLPVALLLAACAVQIVAFHGLREDDAFISYRYGQNLAEGRGLVFNPGQRFLGATSPAHMLLSALIYALSGRDLTPSVMAAVGCSAWTAQAGMLYALLGAILGRAGAAAVAMLVIAGGASSYAWVPMETNLVVAVDLAVLLAIQRGRTELAAVLMAAACLVRPDACLLAALLFALGIWKQPRRTLRGVAWFLPIVTLWLVFAFYYYGSPLPHSAIQKFHRTEPAVYFQHVALYVGRAVVPFGAASSTLPVALALIPGAVFIVARRARALGVLALYPAMHLGAYLWLRPFVGHDWHLYPAVLAVVVYVASGLVLVARDAAPRLLRWSAGAVVLGWIVLAAFNASRAAQTLVHSHWTGYRDRVYRDIAAYLAEQARAGEEFASIEVGTLAYYSDLPAYDLGGLVTDLRRDRMASHAVRYVVLDSMYRSKAPPVPAVFVATEQDFSASVYPLPRAPR